MQEELVMRQRGRKSEFSKLVYAVAAVWLGNSSKRTKFEITKTSGSVVSAPGGVREKISNLIMTRHRGGELRDNV